MANHEIVSPPVFNGDIRKFETTDKAHADVFNAPITDLINNDVYLKSALDTRATTQTFYTTLPTNWTNTVPYSITVEIEGVMETDDPIVDIVTADNTNTADQQEKAWQCVSKIVTNTNAIVVTCRKKKPTVPIPIKLKVVR